MTLAAVKKLAFKLPLTDRLKLVKALQKEIPPMRKPVTLEELERRADEVDAGTAKLVSSEEFDAKIAQLRASFRRKRPAQRG
jgi:putative addiction module component (TIGR02574 family)